MATGKLSNFKKETLSFFYTVFTLLFLISIFTHDPDDPSFSIQAYQIVLIIT